MIDRQIPRLCMVLVDDGEGGRSDDILHAQFLTDSLYKRGLTRSHTTVEGKDLAVAHLRDKLAGGLTDML